MDVFNAAASGSISLGDYFEEQGCRYLAHAILQDSIEQVVNDPEHKQLSTQFEIAWLKGDQQALVAIEMKLARRAGQSPGNPEDWSRGVTAEEVFTTLNVGPQVADLLINLAVNRPEFMRQHIKALKELIEEPAADFIRVSHASLVEGNARLDDVIDGQDDGQRGGSSDQGEEASPRARFERMFG